MRLSQGPPGATLRGPLNGWGAHSRQNEKAWEKEEAEGGEA